MNWTNIEQEAGAFTYQQAVIMADALDMEGCSLYWNGDGMFLIMNDNGLFLEGC